MKIKKKLLKMYVSEEKKNVQNLLGWKYSCKGKIKRHIIDNWTKNVFFFLYITVSIVIYNTEKKNHSWE